MNTRRFLLSALVCAATVTAYEAGATETSLFERDEDAVAYRRAAFTLIGEHMGRIHTELRVARPDPQKLRASSEFIGVVSGAPWETFLPSTAKVKGSKAKPEIWKDRARFDQLAENMRGEARKLTAAAVSGEVAAIRSQFGNVGKTCKACHDDFKSK